MCSSGYVCFIRVCFLYVFRLACISVCLLFVFDMCICVYLCLRLKMYCVRQVYVVSICCKICFMGLYLLLFACYCMVSLRALMCV